MSQSAVAIARIVGPISAGARACARAWRALLTRASAGSLFAWSASSTQRWPLDYHFVFHVAAVVYLGALLTSFLFGGDVSKKKPLPVVNDETSPDAAADDDVPHAPQSPSPPPTQIQH